MMGLVPRLPPGSELLTALSLLHLSFWEQDTGLRS
jgi:hypothetical protein